MDLIDGNRRQTKNKIAARYETAALISTYLAKLQDSKNEIQIPYAWDVYPDLFAKEKQQFEEQQKAIAIREAGISRREYARYFNRRRESGGLIK